MRSHTQQQQQQHPAEAEQPEAAVKDVDMEAGKVVPSDESSQVSSYHSRSQLLDRAIHRAQAWGILESRGIAPAPLEERTDVKFYSLVGVF